MTLKNYVEKNGGESRAARMLHISRMTLYKWLHGRSRPTGLYAMALKQRGIKL